MSKIIYLDNNATTKLDPRVLVAMMPFLTESYANAASIHPFGVEAHGAVKNAREQVADLFTSSATEAINLAIKGVAEAYQDKGKHIVTVSTEHPAVLDTCRYLEGKGFEITYLPVQEDGLLDLEVVKHNVRNDTILVSVMFVNNEIGVIQPIKEIAEIAHSKGTFFMTDGTQAVGKLPVNVNDLGIDLMSFSGHKFYGPKGIGALYVRSKRPNKVKLNPLIHGGGHEKGMRSGTLNVPGIVGLGKAAEIARQEMETDAKRIGGLRDYLEKELLKIEHSFLNGNPTKRLYNVSNICFKGADSDAVMVGLKGIMISNGSACTSTKIEPSHVLKALGRSYEEAYSSIRFSLGRFNTRNEIDMVIHETRKVVESLRLMVNEK
ncbi:MAG: IscS subfamily cysteine desulfurase [Candidatus Brocadia sp.]|nr:MAG: IscS subfamily cysteine desulfurase [Candidatus Brocadia sp.]